MGSGIKKKIQKSALERIQALEEDFQRFISSLGKVLENNFGQLATRLGAAEEVVQAIVDTIGKDKIKEAIDANRVKKAEIASAQAQLALSKAVEAGLYEKTDIVTEKALLVGVEKDKDGKPFPPGRFQVTFDTLKPEYQAQLLGAVTGKSVETEEGGTFEISEIFVPTKKLVEQQNQGAE